MQPGEQIGRIGAHHNTHISKVGLSVFQGTDYATGDSPCGSIQFVLRAAKDARELGANVHILFDVFANALIDEPAKLFIVQGRAIFLDQARQFV